MRGSRVVSRIYEGILGPYEGFQKGVPWADVVCYAHRHGGQIQTSGNTAHYNTLHTRHDLNKYSGCHESYNF